MIIPGGLWQGQPADGEKLSLRSSGLLPASDKCSLDGSQAFKHVREWLMEAATPRGAGPIDRG